MLMVISPAKTLDNTPQAAHIPYTQLDFLAHSRELITVLRKKNPADLAKLMSISDALAVLNAGRFADWHTPFGPENAKQAVLAFMGDVYEGLDASHLDEDGLSYLQQHLRILSGLYGSLRPLDLMQPYRLEMGTRLENGRGKDLYAFWGSRISDVLAGDMAGEPLINLASEEYFGAVKPALLPGEVISPVFQDEKGGKYKIISFHAKKARGLMARYIIKQRLTRPEQLLEFDLAGYAYCPELSTPQKPLFRRPASAA